MILPETPTGYTRESGYPKGSRSGGMDTLVDKFFIAFDKFDLEDLEDMENLGFGELVVNSSSWDINENQSRVRITLNYSEPSQTGVSWSATIGTPEYTLDDSGTEIAINKRKKDKSLWFTNYKVCHNYILAAKTGIASSPTWALTSTDLTDADNIEYKWIKEAGELPDGWYILQDKTKNIEMVISPAPVVVETTYFKSYTRAVANIIKTGTVKDPGKTFGKTGQWLVMGSGVSLDGRRWVVTTRHQLALEWDSDYYSKVQNEKSSKI